MSKPRLFCSLVPPLCYGSEEGKEQRVSNIVTKEDPGGEKEVFKKTNIKPMSLLSEKKTDASATDNDYDNCPLLRI